MYLRALKILHVTSFARLLTVASLIISTALLFPCNYFASETDQFRLPAKPLADIGYEVSEHVENVLRKTIKKINNEIAAHEACLKDPGIGGCRSFKEETARLKLLRSNDAIASGVYRELGAGFLLFTKSGTWMELHRFRGSPSRYKPKYWESVFVLWPVNNLTTSSTVNLYGVNLGTDKLEHMFQQGFQYYTKYNSAIAKGATPEEASHQMISWGQSTEKTFFGTLVSGVYSNADLYANYAGFKFYQGLTQPQQIDEETRPPVLLLRKNIWVLNETASLRQSLLEPFISDHLNEALNPSVYAKGLGLLSEVRTVVRKQNCVDWLNNFPDRSRSDWENVSQSLRQWHGSDYGFTESNQVVTIANTCFEDESKKTEARKAQAD